MKKLYLFLTLALGFIAVRVVLSQSQSDRVPLSAPWTNNDIGSVQLPGAASIADSTYELSASGGDPFGPQDAIHFAHQPATGDAVLIARLASITGTNGAAKAGIMFRASLEPGAASVLLAMGGSNRVVFQRRSELDEPSEKDAFTVLPAPGPHPQTAKTFRARVWLEPTNTPSSVCVPLWLMLVRRGDVFASYTSGDGSHWQWLATEQIKMPATLLAGLAVGGFRADALAAARFDHLTLQSSVAPAPTPLVGVGRGLPVTFLQPGSTNSFQRVSPTINLDGAHFGPLASSDLFTLAWEGFLEPQFTEPYLLQLVHSDCARLWLDGQLLIDDCQTPTPGQSKVLLNLVAGAKIPLRIECLRQTPRDSVNLIWSSPSTPRQIVPQTQLYAPAHPAIITGTNSPSAGIPIDLSSGLAALESADRLPQLPHPWLARSLSPLTNGGSVQPAGSGFVARGAGSGFGRAPDDAFFTYQPWNGDLEIIARVTHANSDSAFARAGLMIRADLRPDAFAAFLETDPRNRLRFFFRKRLAPGQFLPPNHRADPWLKLVRRGDTFSAFSSRDQVQWKWLGSIAVPMPAAVFVGFAVGTGDPDQPHQARFDDLQLVTPQALSPVTGSGDGLSALYIDQTSGNQVRRIDPQINFTWGLRSRTSPDPGIGGTNFVARWEGLLEAQFSEPLRLHLIGEEPVRLWFDGKLLINGARPANAAEQRADLQLLAAHRYAIRLEYDHADGFSGLRLLWSSPSLAKNPIPQSQLYSRDNPAFADLPDKDHDGMPDDWELAHNLDPLDASDAATDPDHDGLVNLDEFRAGTDPQNPDTDADLLPDAWELAHGLNPLDPSDASLDPDHDGLSNLREFLAGTDPRNPDTDADGLPDSVELNDTATNPLLPDTSAILTLAEIPGTNTVSRLGQWAAQGPAAWSVDGRGALEYLLEIPQPDIYRLEILGGSHNTYDRSAEFDLLASIDGEDLGRFTLAAHDSPIGSIHILTPFLKPGSHRLRLFWDNALWRRSFQLAAIRLQNLVGPDTDNNGLKDWVEKRLKNTSAVEVAPATSFVSPACIEGRALFPGLMNVRGPARPQPALSRHWYADIPLSPSNPTPIICSFENDALRSTNLVTWRPTNLLLPTNLTLRAGDSLLLAAMPPGATNGQMLINILGVTNYTSPAGQPVPHQFPTPGRFTLVAAYQPGPGQSRTSSVTVIAPPAVPNPAVWTGKLRPWQVTLPSLPAGDGQGEGNSSVTLDPDLALRLKNFDSPLPSGQGGGTPPSNSPLPPGEGQGEGNSRLVPLQPGEGHFGLETTQPDNRYLLARLAPGGPILTNILAEGFRLYSGYETAVRRIQSYDDGSELVEMGLVLSPLRQNITVQIDVLVGGVTFDDGTLTRSLTSADFDTLGRAKVRFIRPPTFKTSVCHVTRIFQGETLIGIYP